MSEPRADLPELPPEETGPVEPARRPPRDPASTLMSAMVVYIFVNLLFALPLTIFPELFFDAIGVDGRLADELGGMRWLGAALLAWAVAGILVLARPEGRAIFVTTGALQLTFAGLASLYTWSVASEQWALWYHVVSSAVLSAGAIYLWWARLRARAVFKGGGSGR